MQGKGIQMKSEYTDQAVVGTLGPVLSRVQEDQAVPGPTTVAIFETAFYSDQGYFHGKQGG